MEGLAYLVALIVFALLPILAGMKRRWWPLGFYAVGCLIMLQALLRDSGDWDALWDIAMMLVFVIPLYLVGTIVWIAQSIFERRMRKKIRDQ